MVHFEITQASIRFFLKRQFGKEVADSVNLNKAVIANSKICVYLPLTKQMAKIPIEIERTT